MITGISVYLNYDIDEIIRLMIKAHQNGFSYVFTSLHIPEDNMSLYKDKFIRICELSKKNEMNLIVDISPRTLKLFDIDSFEELSRMGVNNLRPDFGFSIEDIVKLSDTFNIVVNASTLTEDYLNRLLENGLNTENLICCHNFYPKKYTGLSENKVKHINNYLHKRNIKTIGFVMGDETLRGPLYEGLPTVEEFRNDDVFYNALYMHMNLENDVVIIGDFGLKDSTFKKFNDYRNGYIEIECSLLNGYDEILGYVHHDRVDNSEYFIRSHESIYANYINRKITAENTIERHKGDICISNENYLRYNGELEIMLKNLPMDERVNVIGHTDSNLICFIDDKTGVLLKKL